MCNSACLVHKLKSSTCIIFKCLLQTNLVFCVIIFLKEGLTPASLPLSSPFSVCHCVEEFLHRVANIFKVTEVRTHPLPSKVIGWDYPKLLALDYSDRIELHLYKLTLTG